MIVTIAAAMSAMMGPTALAEPVQTDPQREVHQKNRKSQIIVRPPKSEGERRQELREFTREIVRKPRRKQAIAHFRYPVCPQVIGIPANDARAIEMRIRENAKQIGVGANNDPNCVPTIRAAFMSPNAGAAKNWLNENSPQLAQMPIYQRRVLLAEEGPVRAYNRVVLRDSAGLPLRWGEKYGRVVGEWDRLNPTTIQPYGANDPIGINEITGAAVMIERDAAEGFTLAQLADYITMRTLLATSIPDASEPPAAATILTLFDTAAPPPALTVYDKSLLNQLYNASAYSSPRRVIMNVAANAVAKEGAK